MTPEEFKTEVHAIWRKMCSIPEEPGECPQLNENLWALEDLLDAADTEHWHEFLA